MKRLVLIALLATSPAFAQAPRVASDFDIEQMERQIASSRDFLSQLSARLNLGDLRATRNERSLARAEYTRALDVASRERLAARAASHLTRYATATAYAGLAQAKLGRDGEAFALLEEAIRYTSESAKTWNLYSSAMTVMRQSRKSASAARNAVHIATREVQDAPTVANRLDLAIYQHTLATALIDLGERAEAERLLVIATDALQSPAFDELKADLARRESFEIYSTARGEGAAYLSLLNRAQLRLASLYEQKGDVERARATYQRVLATRSDDATALGALARLARNDEERERFFAEALEANPFLVPLIREYQQHLRSYTPKDVDDSTTGGQVRRALVQLARDENRAARATLDALLKRFPDNDTLHALRRQAEAKLASGEMPRMLAPNAPTEPTGADLRELVNALAGNRVTPEQRVTLDQLTLTNRATFDASTASAAPGQTVFESGAIDGVPFRFSEPTAFAGTFAAATPLRLTYRILGATQHDGRDALLLEPLRLEEVR